MSSTFRSVSCKICRKQAACREGTGGIVMLPTGWERFEDQTSDRRGPLAAICSERCKSALKEKNRISRAQRMGS